MSVTVFDLISPAAFSSLWYWVVVALVWTRVAQAPMGLPVDAYDQARRIGGDDDAFALLRTGVARHLGQGLRVQQLGVALWAFLLSSLAGLAVLGLELAQALLFLAAPLGLAHLLVRATAQRMAGMEPALDPLLAELARLRLRLQIIAVLAIFVTAVYGMLHTLGARAF